MGGNSIEINCRSFPPATGDLPRVTVDETGATQVSCGALGDENVCLAKSTGDAKKRCYLQVDALAGDHGEVAIDVLACRTLNKRVRSVEGRGPVQAVLQSAKDGTTRCLCPKKGTSGFDDGVCKIASGILQEDEKSCPFEVRELIGVVQTRVVDCEFLAKGGRNFQAVVQDGAGGGTGRVLCTKYNRLDAACVVKSGFLMENQVPCDKLGGGANPDSPAEGVV